MRLLHFIKCMFSSLLPEKKSILCSCIDCKNVYQSPETDIFHFNSYFDDTTVACIERPSQNWLNSKFRTQFEYEKDMKLTMFDIILKLEHTYFGSFQVQRICILYVHFLWRQVNHALSLNRSRKFSYVLEDLRVQSLIANREKFRGICCKNIL